MEKSRDNKVKRKCGWYIPCKRIKYKLLKVPKSKQGLVAIKPAYEEFKIDEKKMIFWKTEFEVKYASSKEGSNQGQ